MSNEKLSVEDALRLENNGLKKQLLQLQAQLLQKDEQMLILKVRQQYNLQQGDEIDPETLEIKRAVAPAPAPEAKPAKKSTKLGPAVA